MDNMPDIEQITKIINAVKTAKMLSEITEDTKTEPQDNRADTTDCETAFTAVDNQPKNEVFAFDRELQSPAIRSIKAAIPYLDYKYQKNMGIIVKLMEMDRLINHYTVLAAESGRDKTKEMLTAIKKELPKENQSMADLLMKVMEIKDIIALNMQNA